MKVTKMGNLYQLTLWPKIFPVNCYLYEEQEEVTLIDAGMTASYKGIVEAIEKLGKPLTNIVLTHAHADHVGALDNLKNSYPDACVSISVRDCRLMKGDTKLNADEPQTPIRGGVPKKLRTKPDRLLKEGDKVGSLEIIETPGHTPGSISLRHKETGIFIVGDALQTKGRVAVCGQIVMSFPFPAFATWNKMVALQSAKKILSLEPSIVAVGHGGLLQNPKGAIMKAIQEAEKN